MISTLTFLSKKLKLLLVLCTTLVALVVSGCGKNNANDYVGTWMGLDETRNTPILYQYEIVPSQDGESFTLRVTQFDYEVNVNHSSAVWRSSAPAYFSGKIDNKGDLVTDIGTVKALPGTFQLAYGDIRFTRKAKNTEVKLKYVIRERIESRYPGITIAD